MMNDNLVDKFIEDNIEKIDNNRWEDLYSDLENKCIFGGWSSEHVGDFTAKILSAGINPLDYLTKVPRRFLFEAELEQDLRKLEIPNNIDTILLGAFHSSNLTDIILPDTIKHIEEPVWGNDQELNLHITNIDKFLKIDFSSYGNPLLVPNKHKINVLCNGAKVTCEDRITQLIDDTIVNKSYVDVAINNDWTAVTPVLYNSKDVIGMDLKDLYTIPINDDNLIKTHD